MQPKISTALLSLVLSIFLLAFLVACDSDRSAPKSESEAFARPAKLFETGQTESDEYLNYPAVIKSHKHTELSFEASGVVKELFVLEAQNIKQGEVLARLDQRDLQTNLKSARAQYDNAEEEYQRAARLIKEDAISRSELEQRKSQRDVNKALLETAEKALQGSVLVAPYAGEIARVSIKKQQAIKAGEPAIEILGAGGLEATINLPSSIIAKAKQQKGSKDDAYLTLSAVPDRRIPAQFKEVTLDADAASQTYEVTLSFKAPEDLNILPGMNATIWFKDPSKRKINESKVSVPLTAIVADGEQKYVWVVNRESMAVTRRNITVEDGIGSYLIVSSGLKLGETIVAGGASSLSEGMIVRPWTK
jgi:RND family efflux transporter MFP subunit